ncbi:MAG: polysaccharide biosynthesis C-terminal domain-containing protein [Ignavibacteria bacterium]|nr:polysaccharide biosynthesis C-terminal domain-containing protein [Ignavibacteria bacterium]
MIISIIKKNFVRFRDTRYIFYSVITDKIFFFVYFLILARLFDKSIYGEIVTLFTLCNVIAFFVNLGIPVYAQRIVAIKKLQSSTEVSVSFFLTTFLMIIYFPLILILAIFLYPTIELSLAILIGIIVYLYNYVSLISAIYNGLEEYKKYFYVIFSVKLIMFLLLIFTFILKVYNVQVFIILLLITVLIQFLVLFFLLYSKRIKVSIKEIKFKLIKEILIILLPLYLATVFNFMYDKVDVLIISKLIDFKEVANYSIAYGIYKSSAIFFMPFLVSGYTKISYLSRRDTAINLFIKKYLILVLIVGILVLMFVFIFSKQIVILLYSSKFEGSINVLRILSVAVVFMGLNNLLGNVLNGLGKFKENRNVTFICLISNILLNLILIPLLGIIAAAVVTVFTEFLVLVGDTFYLRKFIFIKKLKSN